MAPLLTLSRQSLFQKLKILKTFARCYSDIPYYRVDHFPHREQIGHGTDGEKQYFDRNDYPMPSVRYKIETSEIKKLREKEKGDWRKLSIDEKKELYRASFRQTYAEFEHPTGRWKNTLGWCCFWEAVSLWWFMFIYYLINIRGEDGKWRESVSLESRQAQLQRGIALRMDPYDGLASYWDYEKNEWKDEYYDWLQHPKGRWYNDSTSHYFQTGTLED